MQPGRREPTFMKSRQSGSGSNTNRYIVAAALLIALGAAYATWWPAETSAQGTVLLEGRVTSGGAAVAGIPVRARKTNSTFAVSVYTNTSGEYDFPDWADISAGTYAVSITLPDFVHANKEGMTLNVAAGVPGHRD